MQPKTFLTGIHLAESRARGEVEAKPRITWGEVAGAVLLGFVVAWGVLAGF